MKRDSVKRRIGPAIFFSVGALFLGGVFSGCGSLNAVVGGECADGYIDCNGQCSDIERDPRNCGECGNSCAPSVGCTNGVCTGGRDGSVDADTDAGDGGDGDGNADGSRDGSNHDARDGSGDGSNGDGSTSDGSTDGSSFESGDSCAPPYNNVNNCGACGVKCVAPNDQCVAQGVNFICAPTCNLPSKLCFGKCVMVQSDPENCGDCGVVCESNLCVAGVCQGTSRGDIVYLGFDYQSIPNNINISQSRELINAVFLADKTPIRLLAFQKYANTTSVANVTALLGSAQAATGRTIQITTSVDEAFVTSNLAIANYDVLLVYDQETAPANTMGAIGTAWATKLGTFTKNGGVFITLDGVSGANPQMQTFETNTGLLSVTAHTALASALAIDLVAPGDAVGVGVTTPYGTRTRSTRFVTEANGVNGVTYVATESVTKQPNAVHKVAP